MSKKTQVPKKKKKFTGPSTYPLPIVLQSIMRQSIMRQSIMRQSGGGFTFLLVMFIFSYAPRKTSQWWGDAIMKKIREKQKN